MQILPNILFYSNVHLGDLHLSRQYVKWFIDNIPNVNFYYTHNQHPDALCDLNLTFIHNNLYHNLPQYGDIINLSIDNIPYIAFNTWIGAGGLAIGCNFESSYVNFTKYLNYLINNNYCKNTKLMRLVPKIDFSSSCIKKDTTDYWFKHAPKKLSVLIANNKVMSNQSYNTNMNVYISNIAINFTNINFYLTNQEEPLISLPNVFYIEQIINNPSKFYLNDIAYFSTFCDIIVGKGSGPFSFCEIEENINKTWISFTFEHLKSDAFNGLNQFNNTGRYIHTMNMDILTEILKERTNQYE